EVVRGPGEVLPHRALAVAVGQIAEDVAPREHGGVLDAAVVDAGDEREQGRGFAEVHDDPPIAGGGCRWASSAAMRFVRARCSVVRGPRTMPLGEARAGAASSVHRSSLSQVAAWAVNFCSRPGSSRYRSAPAQILAGLARLIALSQAFRA